MNAVFLVFAILPCSWGAVTLEEKGTLFLPEQGRVWDTEVVEDCSYDKENKHLYVVGGRYRFVIDLSSPEKMTVLDSHMTLDANREYADIAVCGDYFIVTTDNRASKSKGAIEIYKRYDETDGIGSPLFTKELGEDVDSVKFFPECKMAIATVRGSAYSAGGSFVDPKGKIVLVELPAKDAPGDFADNVKVSMTDFEKFDAEIDELKEQGTRVVYDQNGNKFSDTADPVSIAISEDGKKAYIVLQTSNAIATFDLAKKTVTAVHGLGMKDWSQLTIDASDKDGGIMNSSYAWLKSFFLPDGISTLKHGGKTEYIITANEGSDVEYDEISWKETITGKEFVSQQRVADSVNSTVRDLLSNDTKLGRLEFTLANNGNNTGGYSSFVALGGRSFSIWRADTLDQVFDSGDMIERVHAESYPDLFNIEVEGDKTPKQGVDSNSPKRGPEPESVTVGHLGDRDLIIIGNERPGTVMVYSVGSDIRMPKFETLWHGVMYTNKTWSAMFDSKESKGIDPEEIIYLDSGESPNGKPGLIVIGAVSSTVTYLEVVEKDDTPTTGASGLQMSLLLLLTVFFVHRIVSA